MFIGGHGNKEGRVEVRLASAEGATDNEVVGGNELAVMIFKRSDLMHGIHFSCCHGDKVIAGVSVPVGKWVSGWKGEIESFDSTNADINNITYNITQNPSWQPLVSKHLAVKK